MQGIITAETIEAETHKAVAFLSRWPGVRRIWLFGSAAKGRRLDWRSDLDFAVEGMAPLDRYRAWSELDQQMSMSVDLVCIEAANPTLRHEIRQFGKILYEA
jgi:predicted nucleotidyltransferase